MQSGSVWREVNIPMQDAEERWRKLCEQAAKELDPEKLLQLVKEINAILEAKEKEKASRIYAVTPPVEIGRTGS